MKKSLILILIAVIVFTACGNTEHDAGDVSQSIPHVEPVPELEPEPEIPEYIIIRDKQYSTELTELSIINDLTNAEILPLEYMVNLESLNLFDNNITDILPLSNLKNLTILVLTDNHIDDLSPLSGLTNLTELIAVNNQVADLSPLSRLINLQFLALHGNPINDITPLHGLKKLTRLSIDEDAVSQEQLTAFQAAVPGCEVILRSRD